MIINKYINGGGGSGSGSTGPQGPQGPIGPQGPQGEDGINQDPTLLKSVSVFPASGETGDVVAKITESGTWGWDVPYGENLEGATYTFPADFDITQYNQSNQYFVGKFVNTAREGDEMYGEYNVYVFNDTEAGPIVRLANDDIDEAEAYSVTIPTMGETEGDYGSIDVTYDATNPAELFFGVSADPNLETPWAPEFQLVEGASLQSIYESDGIYQYDGSSWNEIGGGEGGDSHVLKSSSGTPENISVGDVYSIHNESGTDAYILDEVEIQKALVLVSFPNGSDQGEDRWSSAYLNIKIFEWPESAYTATNIEFWGNYYDINVDPLNQSVCIYDRQSQQNAICISVGDSGSITLGTDTAYPLDIDYSFSDEGDYMDFNINVSNYGEIIWEYPTDVYAPSTENVTSKLAKGEYNGRLMKWVGAGEWGTWLGMGDGGYNDTGNDQMVTLNYSYLPSGQTKLGDTYYFNNYKSTVVYDSDDNTIKVYEDTGLTSLYATVQMGDMDVQANNNFTSVYITWIEGMIQFRLSYFTNVRNRVSTAVGDLHYEVAAEDYAHKVIHPYDTADGIPVWNKDGIIIGRRTAYNQHSLYINDTGYSQYAHIVTDGNWYLPERIWAPTTGGAQGQVLTSNGDTAPVWETRIKAVKITSAAYEALAVKDPNTLYLIDDEA